MDINCADLLKISNKISNDKIIKSKITPWVEQALDDLKEQCILEMPFDSGTMAKGTRWEYNASQMRGEIGVDDSICPYAKFIFGGTRAHTIVPRHEKALQWFVGGFAHYAKSVDIPARKANPFLLKSYENHKAEFINKVETGITQILGNP